MVKLVPVSDVALQLASRLSSRDSHPDRSFAGKHHFVSGSNADYCGCKENGLKHPMPVADDNSTAITEYCLHYPDVFYAEKADSGGTGT